MQVRIQDFRIEGGLHATPTCGSVGVVDVLYCFLPPHIMHVQPRTTGSQVIRKALGFFQSQKEA